MKIFEWSNGEGPWGAPKGSKKSTTGRRSAGGGNNPQPDLEDVIRMAQERFGNFKGGNGNKKGLIFLGLAAIFFWLVSGFYVVAPDQEGVVLRFGKYVQTTTAGLNYHIPRPIETVLKPQVTRENIVEIGFRSRQNQNSFFNPMVEQKSRAGNLQSVPVESLMLTGDENIVDLGFTVRWRIGNPKDYLFNVDNVPHTIKNLAESVMRGVIGSHPIDDALTGNKTRIQAEAKELLQAALDAYKAGVIINGVELQKVNPPREVIDSFRDVQAARADAEKAMNEATGYANDILPRARGQAAQILQNAEGYKEARISKAEGEAGRFISQLREYRKAPEVTRKRLYLETMEEVLKGAEKIILPEGAAGNILPYLPLKKGDK